MVKEKLIIKLNNTFRKQILESILFTKHTYIFVGYMNYTVNVEDLK